MDCRTTNKATSMCSTGQLIESFASNEPKKELSENDKETQTAKQYNAFAENFSKVVIENNRDSNSAYFSYFAPSLTGKFVLDLGCGNGYDLCHLKSRGATIFGIDASEEMVRIAQQKNPDAEIRVGYFDKIPFPDHSFDLIISKWAFQTAARIDPIYEEISRVLKIDGQLIYLSSHPVRQFMENKRSEKNYFKKEMVQSVFFGGEITVTEPSHTMKEYLSPIFFKHFSLMAFDEGYDSGAEKVNGDIYPSYFIIKANRR